MQSGTDPPEAGTLPFSPTRATGSPVRPVCTEHSAPVVSIPVMKNESNRNGRRTTAFAGALGAGLLAVLLTACGAGTGSVGDGQNGGGSAPGTEAPVEENPELQARLLGAWSSDDAGNPHLRFAEDGRVSGSDGCNSLGGEYTVDGDTVTVKRAASTLMACPGVDDWLRGVKTVSLDGDTMTVRDKNGDELGQLHRDAES